MWRFKIFSCWYQNVQRDSDINKFRESPTRSHSKEHGRPSDCLCNGLLCERSFLTISGGVPRQHLQKSLRSSRCWVTFETDRKTVQVYVQSHVAILKCHPPCFVFLNKITNQPEACPSGKMDWPAGSQDLPVSNHSSTGVTRTWHHILLFGDGTQFLRITASVSVLSI